MKFSETHEYGINRLCWKAKLQVLTYMQYKIERGATSVILDGRDKV